jgi:hypothetical protein
LLFALFALSLVSGPFLPLAASKDLRRIVCGHVSQPLFLPDIFWQDFVPFSLRRLPCFDCKGWVHGGSDLSNRFAVNIRQ